MEICFPFPANPKKKIKKENKANRARGQSDSRCSLTQIDDGLTGYSCPKKCGKVASALLHRVTQYR